MRTTRREAFRLARDSGATIVTRPMFRRDKEPTVRDAEPLAAARAARDLELAAHGTARDYIRQAREAGHGWEQIGEALGLVPGGGADQEGATGADAAYTYAVGRQARIRAAVGAEVLRLDLPVLRQAHQRPRPHPRPCRRRTRPRRRLPPARRLRRRVERQRRGVGRRMGGRQMTTHQPALTLPDDGIIDLIAVEIAARGTRPVALTRAEGRLAAAAILARGGTPNLISNDLVRNYSIMDET